MQFIDWPQETGSRRKSIPHVNIPNFSAEKCGTKSGFGLYTRIRQAFCVGCHLVATQLLSCFRYVNKPPW